MGNIVGIDLGTTNSVAAFKIVEVEVVTNYEKSGLRNDPKLTRSVVALSQDHFVVGEQAYNQENENVIISIKRLIGRGFGDSEVQQQLSRFCYKITQSTQGTENSLSVWLGDKEYDPEDISAEILKKVVQNAETYQERKGQRQRITDAVITIPAYFNDKQRHATQIAATKAGLNKCELLPEPTAAAISYGFKPDSEDVKTILVYDFGGGTFDSSIVTAAGNQFIESGKAGDLWLGGDDIDDHFIEFVKQQVAEEEDLDDIDGLIAKMPFYQRSNFLRQLKMAVEQAKIQLSSDSKTRIVPPTPLMDDLGMAISIDVEITREQFEGIILPLVERSIAVCKKAIKYSDYPEDMIDVVLLVGGSSQIPLVQRKVTEAFGADKVVVHPRPMYAIAEGAAIVAAGLIEKVGTVSRDYCIELINDHQHQLIKRGDILPAKTTHTFRTEADGQSLIHFKFYSPDDVSKRDDERIGDMWLALDKAYPKGTEVLVTAELDEKNNSLEITAILKNDPSVRVSGSFSRGKQDEDISSKVERFLTQLDTEGNLTESGSKKANDLAREALQAASRGNMSEAKGKLRELEIFADDDYDTAKFFIAYFKFITGECGFLLPSSQKGRLEKLSQDLEGAISRNAKGDIQKLCEDAEQELKNLPEKVSLILACRDGVSRAHQIEPNHARVLAGKLSQMIEAMRREDGREAQRLFEELAKGIEPYITQALPTTNNSIATGLTR